MAMPGVKRIQSRMMHIGDEDDNPTCLSSVLTTLPTGEFLEEQFDQRPWRCREGQ